MIHLRPKFFIFIMLTIILIGVILILISLYSGNPSYPGPNEIPEPVIQTFITS